MKPLIEISYEDSSKKDLFIILNVIIFILCIFALSSIISNFDTESWFVFILSIVGILMSINRIKNISKIKKISIYPNEIIVNDNEIYKKEDTDFIYIKPVKYGLTYTGIFILKKRKKLFRTIFPIATIYFKFIGGQLIYTSPSSIQDYFKSKKISCQISEKEKLIEIEQVNKKFLIRFIVIFTIIVAFLIIFRDKSSNDEKINTKYNIIKPVKLEVNTSNYIIDINNSDRLIIDYPFY